MDGDVQWEFSRALQMLLQLKVEYTLFFCKCLLQNSIFPSHRYCQHSLIDLQWKYVVITSRFRKDLKKEKYVPSILCVTGTKCIPNI